MSAAEKLKALDAKVTERKARIENALASTQDIEALHVLDALPQIVAVVEAATGLYERVEMDESVGVCLSSRGESLALAASLAALDEALT